MNKFFKRDSSSYEKIVSIVYILYTILRWEERPYQTMTAPLPACITLSNNVVNASCACQRECNGRLTTCPSLAMNTAELTPLTPENGVPPANGMPGEGEANQGPTMQTMAPSRCS
jgi:hypothetical protein